MDVIASLQAIRELLQQHGGDSAEWIDGLIALGRDDETAMYRALNSKRMWGGAGSIANEALANNPGMDDWSWQMHIRELRERLIELGEYLASRGEAYPDIGQWVMAFSHWNQSEV